MGPSIKGETAPILKDTFKIHQNTTGHVLRPFDGELKDTFKIHQNTTAWRVLPVSDLLKDTFKIHQNTTFAAAEPENIH